MSLKHQIRLFLRRFGIEVSRYNVAQSQDLRLARMLQSQQIDTVIDVGANDGGYGSSLLDAGYGGAILSFEPLASVHGELEARAQRTSPRWAVAPRMALGSEQGEATINVAGNSVSSSLLQMGSRHLQAAPQSRYVATENVPVFRLDAVKHPTLEAAKRTHLKIDTQGFEMQVLLGATALLPRVQGLQLEMSLTPLYEGQVLFRPLLEWVYQQGFELHGVVPGFMDVQSGRTLQVDGIFFRP